MVERGYCIYSISLNILTYFLHLNNYLVTLFHNTICRAQFFCPFLLSASEYLLNMLFSYHLLYFCTALSLIIMLSSHYHHHKSKTFSQLTQCPFTGTLLLSCVACKMSLIRRPFSPIFVPCKNPVSVLDNDSVKYT